MGSENEPAKLLLPYLQRADELQKHEPLVAYYCRLYAMERGLKIPQSDRTKTTNALLVSLMKQLEKDKKSLKLGPDDHLHVEGFALNVFTKADKQDRAGRADLNTAKTFYAASIFFEILNQFGELQPDLEQKQKYAAWKAADIRKAVKEGRKPLPGPPGGDNDLAVPSSTSAGEYDLEPSRSDFAPEPDPTRVDPSAIISPRSDSSPHQPYNQDNFQHPTNISPRSNSSPHQPYNQDNFQHPTNISPRSDSSPHQPYNQDNFQHPTNISSSSDSSSHQPYNQDNFQHPTNISPCPDSSPHQPYNQDNFQHPTIMLPQHSNVTPSTSPSISQMPVYPTDNYPSDNFHQPPSSNVPENSIYHQSYQHQPYQPDPEQHFPQNYPSHEVPSYSYPNFQSYPSFTETSLPTAPSHHPSYHQGSNVSLANSLPSNTAAHPSVAQYNSSARNGIVQEASPHTAEKYEYDSNYQPPPEKIAEAHKAARFAVGALAFDDVSTAVDCLKKSLELLTNPSAGH